MMIYQLPKPILLVPHLLFLIQFNGAENYMLFGQVIIRSPISATLL
jgi:hypothetical protein